jgi:hypothetical protein
MPPGHTLIYALADPTTGAIRFVGTTHLPAACLRAHMSGKRSQSVPGLAAWVAGLVEAGTPPQMLELATESGDLHRLCSHERHWVDRLREMGEQLFNA